MSATEPRIVASPLCGEFSRDGITVEVQICRLEQQLKWTLEVVDAERNSIVWTEEFPTDQAAYDTFISDVEREGLAKVISGDPPPTLS